MTRKKGLFHFTSLGGPERALLAGPDDEEGAGAGAARPTAASSSTQAVTRRAAICDQVV